MSLAPDTAAGFEAKFGFPLTEAYGIIEVGLPFVRTRTGSDVSLGKPLPAYEVRIVDPDGEGVGTIQLRGKGMFDAYFSPWRPRAECLHEGWFDTGDMGRIDPGGALRILGRRKAVINSAGVKIFPGEIEAILNKHPLVAESLVFGVPDARYGQLPRAHVVLREEAGESVTEIELRRFCYRHLSAIKVPQSFEFVRRLHRTASGKLRRKH